jgi:stress-induced morphogen
MPAAKSSRRPTFEEIWPVMPMAASEIEQLIKAAIPDAEVTIRDLAGDGDHYAARVVSPSFAGLSRIKQHQAVYSALGGRVGGELHALQLETAVPQPENSQ